MSKVTLTDDLKLKVATCIEQAEEAGLQCPIVHIGPAHPPITYEEFRIMNMLALDWLRANDFNPKNN